MKRFESITITLLTLVLGSVAAVAQTNDDDGPPPLDRTVMDLADYRAAADSELPVWTPSILSPAPGPDWMAGVSVARVAVSVGDSAPMDQSYSSGPLTEARNSAETKVVKLDMRHGRVRYANRDRLFDWNTSPHTAFPMTASLTMVLDAADQLGIPDTEYQDATGGCPSCRVDTVLGRDFLDSDMSGNPFSTHQAERMVTFERSVGGLRVFASLCRASVSNTGQISRLLVRWPQFRLMNNGALSLRTRAAVLDDIAAGLWNAEFGAALDHLAIELGYARVGADYVPAAEVFFRDRDSGAGFMVPLVVLAADADFDGEPDASDNCPNVKNTPHQVPFDCNADGDFTDAGEATGDQCDRDADGVGDECDNCPGVSNATQADGNNNGIGDACEEPQGACIFSGGECDTLPLAHCMADGGSYQGDGTVCDGVACVSCQLHGDVHPIGPPSGNCMVNLDDILCTLAAFANPASCPSADIAPCSGNDIYNLDDILAVLSSFGGDYGCGHPCPP